MGWVLKGIDLELYQGELIGLLGSNGSGKSTLLEKACLKPPQALTFSRELGLAPAFYAIDLANIIKTVAPHSFIIAEIQGQHDGIRDMFHAKIKSRRRFMDLLYGTFENFVFTKTRNWKFEEISFTGSMLNILFLIDGRNSISEIASKLLMDYSSLPKTLEILVQYNLIERKSPPPGRTQKTIENTLFQRNSIQNTRQDEKNLNMGSGMSSTHVSNGIMADLGIIAD